MATRVDDFMAGQQLAAPRNRVDDFMALEQTPPAASRVDKFMAGKIAAPAKPHIGQRAQAATQRFLQTDPISRVLGAVAPRLAPISQQMGLPTATEVAQRHLPEPGQPFTPKGIAKQAVGVAGRAAAGVIDFLQSPAGLAATAATIASGGAAAPALVKFGFLPTMGAETVVAGKEFLQKPTPENAERFFTTGAVTALVGTQAVPKPIPPAPRPAPAFEFGVRRPEGPYGRVLYEPPAVGEDIVAEVLRRQPSGTAPLPRNLRPQEPPPEAAIPPRPVTPQPVPAIQPAAAPPPQGEFTAEAIAAPKPITPLAKPPAQPAPKAEVPVGPYAAVKGNLGKEIALLEKEVERLTPGKIAEVRQMAQEGEYAPETYRDTLNFELKRIRTKGVYPTREAKTVTPVELSEHQMRNIVETAGGKWRGVQKGFGEIGDSALFDDPQTGSTLAVPLDRLTEATVLEKMVESRKKFAEPAEPGVTPEAPAERRLEVPRTQTFDTWLQDTYNLTHDRLMALPAEEQANIRADFNRDRRWHAPQIAERMIQERRTGAGLAPEGLGERREPRDYAVEADVFAEQAREGLARVEAAQPQFERHLAEGRAANARFGGGIERYVEASRKLAGERRRAIDVTAEVVEERPERLIAEVRQPIVGIRGRETLVDTETAQHPAVYKLVELDELEASHNAMTFEENPRYPKGVQERDYRGSKEAQQQVIQSAQNFKPERIANTDPTHVNGPPMTDPTGLVLGGNGRVMILKRAYDQLGKGEDYKAYLREHAQEFGLDPAQIDALEKPVLVREMTAAPSGVEGMRRIGKELNAPVTKALGLEEAAVSAGKNLSKASADRIANELAKLGEDSTLRQVFDANPKMIREVLAEDAMIAETERAKYFTPEGLLTSAGKDFVEKAFLGSVIDDVPTLRALPKSLVAKLERSIPALMELKNRTDDWNIIGDVKEAGKLIASAQARGVKLSDMLAQGGLFGEVPARVGQLAELLSRKPTEVAATLREFANAARADVPSQGRMFFQRETPVAAWNRIVELRLEQWRLGEKINKRFGEMASGGTLQAELDPTILADLAKLGAVIIERGVRDFGAWSKEMVSNVGERIRPHLKELWEAARTMGPTVRLERKLETVEQMLARLSLPARTILAEGEKTFERGTVRREIREEFYGAERPGYEQTYERKISVADVDRARNALRDAHDTAVHWMQSAQSMGDDIATAVGRSAVDYLNQASRLFKETGTAGGRILQSLQRKQRPEAGLPREEAAPGLGAGAGQGKGPGVGPGKGGAPGTSLPELMEQARALVAQASSQLRGVRTIRQREPVTTGLINAVRERRWPDAARYAVDQLRLNLLSVGSWTLDAIGNASEMGPQAMAGLGHDLVYTTRSGQVSFPAVRGFVEAVRNRWRERRIPMDQEIEAAFGRTAGGERFGRVPTGERRRLTMRERLERPGAFTYRTTKASAAFDILQGAPLYAKSAMDMGAKRLVATATIFRDAIKAADSMRLEGARRQTFIKQFFERLPEATREEANREGNKAGFNRPLSQLEERWAASTVGRLVVDAFGRWPFQFTRWAGEMLGYNRPLFEKLRAGKATPEEIGAYVAKTATGYGGLLLLDSLLYDRTDFNSMEYVTENGDRVRISGREPLATGLWFLALVKGDTDKAAAALRYASIPAARLFTGEGGLATSTFKAFYQAAQNPQNDPRALRRELSTQFNKAIPGQALLSTLKTLFDQTIREGPGANLPVISRALPARIKPTTGEPQRPTQRIPGTETELPSIQGTPIPGMVRVTDPVERLLTRYSLMVYRGLRQPIAGFPPGEVPPEYRREWESELGKERKRLLTPMAQRLGRGELERLPDESMRKRIQTLDAMAARIATMRVSRAHGGVPKLTERRPTFRERAGPEIYQPEAR